MFRFAFEQRYALKQMIRKKWPNNNSNPRNDLYKSLALLYCKDMDALVPMVDIIGAMDEDVRSMERASMETN
jgi:hypothetical protein